jgi:hypothetical protein
VTEDEIEELLLLVQRGNRRIDREVEGFVSTLRLIMQRKILEELSQLPQDRNIRQSRVIRLLGGLESLVLTDDVTEHIQGLEDIFDLQYSLMEQWYSVANDDEEMIDRRLPNMGVFTNSREQNVAIMARAYANEVRQGLADSVITGERISDFDLADVPATRIFNTLETDLKTATASYSRMIAMNQGRKFVLYAGPRDARNRAFCAERVNKIFPVEAVYTWDNGQGIPANLYCGGYGCRHVLIPVAKQVS